VNGEAGVVLVVGASGGLGGRVARRLLDHRIPVRALTRTPAKLAELAARGAEVVQGDLLIPESLTRACAGVDQVFSTANSFLGQGPASPRRVDVPAYRNLVGAARSAGVRRLVHTSAYGVARTSVDFFQVKTEVDEVIRGSGLPWVLLRPSAFLDVWVGLALEQNRSGGVLVFGKGNTPANYVAVEDVARFAVRVLEDPGIADEIIDIGGPSTLTQLELLALVERFLGLALRRKPVPRPVLAVGARMLRPFRELTARFMAMGAWAAATDRSLPHWKLAARRFGIDPMTAEQYLAGLPKEAA
jgi:uncharacterized protein YbjT (DUF2867 family)